MKAQTISLDGRPGGRLVIPAGSHGFYLCPTLEYVGLNSYRGTLGSYPVRVESPNTAWEPVVLRSAGGFTSREPLPLLHVVRDWPDPSLTGTWHLVVLDRPGEQYMPPANPLLGNDEPRLIVFGSDAPESSTILHVAPEVRRVTLTLAAPGAPYEGADYVDITGPTDDVSIYLRIHAAEFGPDGGFGLVATMPSDTRCFSFEPPCPGDYYLHHESVDPAGVGAVAQLLVEVAS